MNSITIVGHVGRDADLTYTPTGAAVAKFSVADSSKRGDKEVTTWYNISCWNKLADVAAQFVKKGTHIMIIGTLATREYTGRDGVAHTSLDVSCDKLHLLSPRDAGATGAAAPAGAAPEAASAGADFPF